MGTGQPHLRSAPSLRLFDAAQIDGNGELSAAMRLSQFFWAWFVPIVLEAEGRDQATIASYAESIEWWIRITRDPELCAIDEFVMAGFKTGLREATYRRGTRMNERRLSEFTIAKHLRQVRAVLHRAGPTTDPNRETKGLLTSVPTLKVTKPHQGLPKRSFTVDEARRIVAATRRMPPTRYSEQWSVPPTRWWRAFLMVLYYTGLRVGTVLKLRWTMISTLDEGEGKCLRMPAAVVEKTHKPLVKFLHPQAVEAVQAIHGDRELVFPWPHWQRHIADRHELLQREAGFPEDRWLSPHAWRRTHGTQMGRLGARYGLKIAQFSLDHGDERTTSEFYVNLEAELILQLPLLEEETAAPSVGPLQLELF